MQISRDRQRGGGVSQMITLDHRGEGGGVWIRPKYDHKILEQSLIFIMYMVLCNCHMYELIMY